MWGRALLVRHGASGAKSSQLQPAASVASLPVQSPGEGEVLVQVQATALTPTDALLCSELRPPLKHLLTLPSAPFVPGHYFCGEVIAVGPFVQGVRSGEQVLGVLDSPTVLRAPPTDVSLTTSSESGEEGAAGGCFRERALVDFSALLPIASVLAAGCKVPSLVAHIPPMVDALFCVARHLKLMQEEVLLIVAPSLGDVIFLLQRLVLISANWIGPLHLVLLHGNAPTRADLERHPLLRPLLSPSPAKVASTDGELPLNFLEHFHGFSVERHAQQRFGASASSAELTSSLREIVGTIVETTGGLGVDVALALDVDLAPPIAPPPEEAFAESVSGGSCNESSSAEIHRPPTLLRTLIGALNLRGRLVTNCGHVEMMPADGEHLWIKEASMSFFNPHALLLSAARKGTLIHAVVEVLKRIADSELPIAESEVVQYRLFEQFNHALEASLQRGSKVGSVDLQLIALLP